MEPCRDSLELDGVASPLGCVGGILDKEVAAAVGDNVAVSRPGDDQGTLEGDLVSLVTSGGLSHVHGRIACEDGLVDSAGLLDLLSGELDCRRSSGLCAVPLSGECEYLLGQGSRCGRDAEPVGTFGHSGLDRDVGVDNESDELAAAVDLNDLLAEDNGILGDLSE